MPPTTATSISTTRRGPNRGTTERSVTTVAHLWESAYFGAVAGRVDWVLLAYRVPREPSTPRIAVWRKLNRLGVAKVVDGLVALPLDARTKEQLEWLGDEIIEAGGEATIWTGRLGSARQERELASRMAEAVSTEYRAVLDAAEHVAGEPTSVRRRTLARLRRELRRIGQRDYFPPAEREAARHAVDELADSVETGAASR
jgi:hypothetical protein